MVGISLYSVIPVRTEPKESAEQSTQILFGETYDLLEQIPRWHKVRLHSDGEEGWIDAKMSTPLSSKEYREYKAAYREAAYILFPMAYAVSENNGQTIPLTAGTRLTNYQNGHFSVLGVGFRIDPTMVTPQPLELNEQNLQQVVRFFLNTPYLWGGKNALGMDCSGFTQTIMSLFGKKLPRNASQQAVQGRALRVIRNARAGDIAFFNHGDGKISHVGIILSTFNSPLSTFNFTIVHCSGRVKVERLDEKGILSVEKSNIECPNGSYSHDLVTIRRL